MNTSNAQELPRAVDLSMLIEPHWRFGPEFGEKELEKRLIANESVGAV